ncbi:hypothetical protein ID866_10596 [Astraeus odoratus]|nr:hypothetical protein ID866_10596 [Astraeus odoratus]
MPAGMLHESLSLVHLMHMDISVQLPLAWTSESICCHFLASAAAATVYQYSCQLSSSVYMHLILPFQLPISASPLPLSAALLPPPSGIFPPLPPGTSVLALLPCDALSLPSVMCHVQSPAFLPGLCITH